MEDAWMDMDGWIMDWQKGKAERCAKKLARQPSSRSKCRRIIVCLELTVLILH